MAFSLIWEPPKWESLSGKFGWVSLIGVEQDLAILQESLIPGVSLNP